MDNLEVFPDARISKGGIISAEFLRLGIDRFINACRYVHNLPYGYNSNRDDLLILFKEGKGTCTTKHAVIATLAQELELPVAKNIGIYAMTEDIVTGTNKILAEFGLPYVPMLHCFLVNGDFRVDLTEGNQNGKNCAVDQFLHTERVTPNISEKDEYLLYRTALRDRIMLREEMSGVDVKRILHAREKGIKLLKSNIQVADTSNDN
jgi:hypothetical protein